MLHCPHCQNTLSDDFGLVTCDSCGRSVFIDMSGEIQSSSEPHSQIKNEYGDSDDELGGGDNYDPSDVGEADIQRDEGVSSSVSIGTPQGTFVEDAMGDHIEGVTGGLNTEMSIPEVDSSVFSVGQDEDDYSPKHFLEDELEARSLTEGEQSSNKDLKDTLDDGDGGHYVSQDQDVETSVFNESDTEKMESFETDNTYFVDKGPDNEGVQSAVVGGGSRGVDLAEIIDFGNSELSQAFNGSVFYKIFIQRIDSDQIRRELEECLSDKKFFWDEMDILSKIENGALTIEGLDAPKAIVFVNRIKYLDIDISWEQYVLQEEL